MLRNIVGVVLGLVLGSIANMALVNANMALFPMEAGAGMEDPEAFQAYIAALPTAAFLLPFFAHFSQVFVGGVVASKVGRASPRILVGIIAGLTVLGSIYMTLTIQAPAWTWIEIPLYGPVIWGTLRLAEKMRGGAPAATMQPAQG